VNISYCSGETLEWCNQTFGSLEAPYGHLEIEIPPGCYVVHAFRIVFIPGAPFPWIIWNSHFAMVMVECDEKACVHIYNPTARQSVHHSGKAGWLVAEELKVPQEKAQRMFDAANSLLEHLPKTDRDEALEQAAQEAASKLNKGGK
jgi:hypothetical protein